jgi:hypothetical protein
MKIWLSSRLIRFRSKRGEQHGANSQGVLCHSVYLFLFQYTWRKMSNEGKATDPTLLDRINRVLKEEQKEKTK